jgi:hypothetical protein
VELSVGTLTYALSASETCEHERLDIFSGVVNITALMVTISGAISNCTVPQAACQTLPHFGLKTKHVYRFSFSRHSRHATTLDHFPDALVNLKGAADYSEFKLLQFG